MYLIETYSATILGRLLPHLPLSAAAGIAFTHTPLNTASVWHGYAASYRPPLACPTTILACTFDVKREAQEPRYSRGELLFGLHPRVAKMPHVSLESHSSCSSHLLV